MTAVVALGAFMADTAVPADGRPMRDHLGASGTMDSPTVALGAYMTDTRVGTSGTMHNPVVGAAGLED